MPHARVPQSHHRRLPLAPCALFLLSLLLPLACARADQPPIFQSSGQTPDPWTPFAAEGVDVALESTPDPITQTPALKLSFDFRLGSGYAGIRRPVNAPLPANYVVSFDLYSDLPDNNLEIKLVSPDGHDVWWVNRRAFAFPRTWTPLASRKRHFEFAWGPSAGAPLAQVGTLEIVVASSEGGRGALWLRNIEFRPLPAVDPSSAPCASFFDASSSPPRPIAPAENPLAIGPWSPSSPLDLAIKLENPSEIAGLDLQYEPGASPAPLTLQSSLDGITWRSLRTLSASCASRQFIRLGEFGDPWLRLTASDRTAPAIRTLALIPIEHATPTAMLSYAARRSPRGLYPRAFLGEQTYWTVVGRPDGVDEALISEDGSVEVGRKDFSIEPFIELWQGDSRTLLTWADGTPHHALADGYLPIPTITRSALGVSLSITAGVDGPTDAGELLVRYTLTNTHNAPHNGRLVLAARPMQVNPPTQWLNLPGGAARVDSLRWEGSTLHANQSGPLARTVVFPDHPAERGLAAAEDGDGVTPGAYRVLAPNAPPAEAALTDVNQAASARIAYDFDLAPGQSRDWWVLVPLTPRQSPTLSPAQLAEQAQSRLDSLAGEWRDRLSKVRVEVPRADADIARTALTTLAYILINKDGPGIQPGSRNYERSWIRDGSLTSSALLAFGESEEVRRFIEWYAPRQFESGAVPCVVDRRGPDPVPEHDSHGQLIWLIWNYYQYTQDLDFLKAQYPHIRRAAEHIQELRSRRQTLEWNDPARSRQEPGKPPVPVSAFTGLVPESISHEGYSAKPMHSYWDDAFCIRGLFDAARAAHAVGDAAFAQTCSAWADDFARAFENSVKIASRAHGIDYIPGCVELGDFDPTSTTVLLWPCQVLFGSLEAAAGRTFERNWTTFTRRRDQSPPTWVDYTPYELRQVGSYVMLGQPERAYEVLQFHMAHRRPAEWNHWAEVVRPGLRTPGFVGDMPHTWCGSDFLNSLRTMFAYERAADDSIVLLAGIPRRWVETQEQLGIHGLVLAGGTLDVTLRKESNTLKIRVSGNCRIPPGGVRIKVPEGWDRSTVLVDGMDGTIREREVRVDQLPRSIELTSPPRP